MLKTFTLGGIHPPENKLTTHCKIRELALPESVSIPLSQHIGAPSKAIVKKGDKVKTGQLIAVGEGFVSSNVHSSVSGTVMKIDKVTDVSGYKKEAIVIKVEDDEWEPNINRSTELNFNYYISGEDIIKKVSDAGIVGLGGATFPSHVKLSVPRGKKAECLVINGVECEPYLTADHMLMLEHGEEIIIGTRILMDALGIKKAVIGIEVNKHDAIEHLTRLTRQLDFISVQGLKVKYPQGGEKQLINALLDKEVPSGGLPVDVGVIAFNVGTAFAVYEAVQKEKPLFERIVTVTGEIVKNPANYKVRIGTPISHVIEATGGIPENCGKIIMGGPMMGKAVSDLNIPVIKGSSGILLMPENQSRRAPVQPCIRCSKCIHVCPMGLEPYLLMAMSERKMFDRLKEENVMDCIECGSCSFTCPASRPLLDYIRYGKSNVLKIMRSKKK